MTVQQRLQSFKLFKTAGVTRVWQVRGRPDQSPFFFEAKMSIDLDGAPDAYAPRGSGLRGRDNLGNAIPIADKQGRPPNSAGWVPTYQSTVRDPRTGASVVQASGPTRGYYVSESSLKDVFHGTLAGPQTDPQYQTDATEYPYLALPGDFLRSSGLSVGDYALAIHGSSGLSSFAVYGDYKKKHVLGESSAALADALGVPSDRNGGVPGGIVYVVFPQSGLGSKMRCSLEQLPQNGRRWLGMWDDRLDLAKQVTACFSPELPGVAQAFRRLLP